MPYRILVVDDSVFMRKMISDLIAEDTSFTIVGTAKNGIEAVEKVKLLKPHAITMDVEMPIMNGLDALQQIMEEEPTPVIMLSSITESGTKETIRALELGAIDFIRKPSGSISMDIYKVKNQLHDKLKMAIQTKLKSIGPSIPLKSAKPEVVIVKPISNVMKNEAPLRLSSQFHHIVAIGTSTGGPRALQTVLSAIPADFPAPILVVQHMPPNFTKSLAQRLNDICSIRVVEAQEQEQVHSGTAYIAPGGWHMKLVKDESRKYRIQLTKEEPRSGHRPSVDTLFESLLGMKEFKRHFVLMTGMGSDGAQALQVLKNDQIQTAIAEAEETCVVYGMPRAAVLLDVVTDVLPNYKIPEKLIRCVTD